MFKLPPVVMIILGALMMTVGGVIIPLLMVIHVIEPGFFLIFLSYAISVAGLYLGIIGVTRYVPARRKDR